MFLTHTPLKSLIQRWKLLVFAGAVVAFFAVLLSLVFTFPPQYRADAQVLVIAKSRYGIDPYTAAKFAEQIGGNVVQIVGTNDFYEKVTMQGGHNLDLSKFNNLSENKKRKLWQKMVDASAVYGTGVLNISVYNKNQEQAKEWTGAVADTLVGSGWEYVGSDIGMKVVNTPVVTNWPVRPNFILNLILGFAVGALAMAVAVVKRG
jgi:capsular polysaccharide biosynthesis protein